MKKTSIFAPPGYTNWKPLKLRDLEFANSIDVSLLEPLALSGSLQALRPLAEGTHLFITSHISDHRVV